MEDGWGIINIWVGVWFVRKSKISAVFSKVYVVRGPSMYLALLRPVLPPHSLVHSIRFRVQNYGSHLDRPQRPPALSGPLRCLPLHPGRGCWHLPHSPTFWGHFRIPRQTPEAGECARPLHAGHQSECLCCGRLPTGKIQVFPEPSPHSTQAQKTKGISILSLDQPQQRFHKQVGRIL